MEIEITTEELEFEHIEPWIEATQQGDTGLSSRLKLRRNFEKISRLIAAIIETGGLRGLAVDYPEWVVGQKYYAGTLNPETMIVERSYVWHFGKKWMCLKSLTTQEPRWGCTDWHPVEGDMEYRLRFYNTETGAPYPNFIVVHKENVRVPLLPKVTWGLEELTEEADSWQWKRYLIDGTEDTGWADMHRQHNITITTRDMPIGWNARNPAKFECIATFEEADIEISADINM